MTRRFGIVEGVIVVEVLALGAYFFTPQLQDAARRGQVRSAAHDIELVCAAASTAHARRGEWSEDGVPGRTPESLGALLPSDFSFERKAYRLDWDSWRLSEGPDAYARTGEFSGVSIIARDPQLARSLVEALGTKRVHFTVGDRSTFVISAPGVSQP